MEAKLHQIVITKDKYNDFKILGMNAAGVQQEHAVPDNYDLPDLLRHMMDLLECPNS